MTHASAMSNKYFKESDNNVHNTFINNLIPISNFQFLVLLKLVLSLLFAQLSSSSYQ